MALTSRTLISPPPPTPPTHPPKQTIWYHVHTYVYMAVSNSERAFPQTPFLKFATLPQDRKQHL